jgi:hypothetical protein
MAGKKIPWIDSLIKTLYNNLRFLTGKTGILLFPASPQAGAVSWRVRCGEVKMGEKL